MGRDFALQSDRSSDPCANTWVTESLRYYHATFSHFDICLLYIFFRRYVTEPATMKSSEQPSLKQGCWIDEQLCIAIHRGSLCICVHPVGVQHPYLPLQQTVGPAEPHGTVSATPVVLLVGLNNETECATMNGSAQPFLLLSFLLWSTVVLCQSLLQALYTQSSYTKRPTWEGTLIFQLRLNKSFWWRKSQIHF